MQTAIHQPNSTALDRYLRTARQAGCPADQLRNFRSFGYVALPKQLRFHAAARECDKPSGPTKIGYGGARGPGKSTAVLAQMGDDCLRFAGAKWLLLRKVGKAAREGFDDLLRKRFPSWLPYYIPSRGLLEFPNGSRIIIGHYQAEKDVDAYLGLEYDGIVLEEATQLSHVKIEMIGTCLRTAKEGWRPRMYYTWNPGGVGHGYIKRLLVEPYRRHHETDTRFIAGTVDDNPHVNPEYRRTLEALTGWMRAAWLEGDMDIAAGQFFTTWRHDLHVRPWFKVPGSWRVWAALDYGFTHYTAAYLLAERDGTIFILDEYAARQRLAPSNAAGIVQMLERNDVSVSRLAVFAAGRDVFAVGKDQNGKTIADQYADEGIVLTAANDDRINGAGELLGRMGDADHDIPSRLVITDRCPRLIECIPSLQHDPHRPEDVLKVDTDEEGNGGDDFYDAARYGVMVAALSITVHRPPPVANRWTRL